jgi:hypothetical protein
MKEHGATAYSRGKDETMNSHANLLPRYKHLREVGRRLASILPKSLPDDALPEAGRKLGILRGKTFVLDTEDEMAVLMDYALHDVRRQGLNAVERYLAETPPPPDSDEMLFLQSLREAHYAILLVEAAEPGVGVQARDLISDDTFFVMDVGFGTSAEPGFVLASRIHTADNITMTTGAGLPVGVVPEKERAGWLRHWAAATSGDKGGHPSPEKVSERTAAIIRSCLEKGAASQIAYQELPEDRARPRLPAAPGHPRPLLAPSAPTHIGRNDPCPCGSGKKFKHCCLRKR